MKIKVISLLFSLLLGACQASPSGQASQNTNLPVPSKDNLPPADSDKQDEEKSLLTGTSQFISHKIKRIYKHPRFIVNLDIEYPQLKDTKKHYAFNRHVKKQVDYQIHDFTSFLTQNRISDNKKIIGEFELELEYEVHYFSHRFTSILMFWSGYSGGMNGDAFPTTINFDLKNGRAVGLKDLFKPGSKYLEKLSEVSIDKLRRICLDNGCDGGIKGGDPLPEGVLNDGNKGGMYDLDKTVSAKQENFHSWSVTKNGLRITFPEYQVAGNGLVPHITIPFSELEPILRKDLDFVRGIKSDH